ncbi:LamG domain-containing protein, partial [Lutibacter sp.]|uniref:LamG domain-containing protein n=1 Tax=Lutibacter sp. TaxID=1925666 RepID=UPI003567B1BB
ITYSSRKDDTSERNKIESYLAIKYGITLADAGIGTTKDYVNSDGALIWDHTSNAGYNYDIAGIGRDDVSALNQKQSSSINNATDATGPIEGILTIGLADIYTTNSENILTNSSNTLGNKQFLVWGNNGLDLSLTATTINVDMSDGIAGLSTPVTFTGMQRIWKVVETGGDVSKVKISIPKNAVRNINPPGSYLMFISDTDIFDPTADYRVMTEVAGNLYTDYDFDSTKYITFGYAPETIVERSIYFDGVVDYVDMEDALDLNTSEFTVSAWIKRGVGSVNKSILSKRDASYTEGYDFKINGSGQVEMSWGVSGAQNITSTTIIPIDEWHQVAVIYNGGSVNLYIDGVLDKTASLSAPVDTTQSFFIAAAGKNTPTAFFEGNIDEVRVWNVALSIDQLRYIMNQELIDKSITTGLNPLPLIKGYVIPASITKNEISAIPWSSLAGYYPMSVYTYTNTNDMSGNGNQGALRNLNTVDYQTAPLPYKSTTDGAWDTPATWLNNSVQSIPNSLSIVDGITPVDWNIVEISDNTVLTSGSRDIKVLGLNIQSTTVDAIDTKLTMDGDNTAGTGNGLTVTHYLKLDGVIDLQGESQLIQTTDSDLDAASTGIIERDQQGTGNSFRYNYWSSPVNSRGTKFTIGEVLKDGTDPIILQNIDFGAANAYAYADGATTSPIKLSAYWMYVLRNSGLGYSAWARVGNTGELLVGEGYTMKGSNTSAAEQNYAFVGKPNNGTFNLPVSANNEYLVGNPYASAIDAYQFIDDNGPTGTASLGNGGRLIFWEHYGGDTHNLRDYQGGYAILTKASGVPASSNVPAGVSTLGITAKGAPERYVPVGQSFFVEGSLTGGNIQFNNGQRIFEKESSGNSIFMKNSTAKSNIVTANRTDLRPKFRIGFDAPAINHRQLLLTIDENTSDAVDWGYEAEIYEIISDDMYWMIDSKKYVIQATNSLSLDKEIPLGIETKEGGAMKIKVDALENVAENTSIYILDNLTGETYNITNQTFEINLEAGEYKERFVLTFQPRLKTLEEVTLIEGVHIFM